MIQRTFADPVTLDVDTMPRDRLLESLREERVQLNEAAATLLEDAIFDRPKPESVTVVERSVSDLGLATGAVLPQIFEAAQERGLQLCPPTTGPSSAGVALSADRTGRGDVEGQGAIGFAHRCRPCVESRRGIPERFLPPSDRRPTLAPGISLQQRPYLGS